MYLKKLFLAGLEKEEKGLDNFIASMHSPVATSSVASFNIRLNSKMLGSFCNVFKHRYYDYTIKQELFVFFYVWKHIFISSHFAEILTKHNKSLKNIRIVIICQEEKIGHVNLNYNKRLRYLTAKRHSKDGKTEGRNICT